VVEGVFYMQQGHALRFGLPWDEAERNARAEKMFDKIFNIRFLPPGRGLWSMGTDIVEKKGLFASLNNVCMRVRYLFVTFVYYTVLTPKYSITNDTNDAKQTVRIHFYRGHAHHGQSCRSLLLPDGHEHVGCWCWL
jgi:hypothetical protein